jgi:Reverse transcriptase (RNA-dependent DNA polymerase)
MPQRPRLSMTTALAHIVAEASDYHAPLKQGAYRRFSIPKPDGSIRWIDAPNARVKAAQQEALTCLERAGIITYSESDHGFRPGHGIATMLQALGPSRGVIQADLSKAFHQVTRNDIWEWAREQGANSRTARWIAHGTTRPVDGLEGPRLVMGSPLAPAILLQVTRHLRQATERLARAFNGTVAWYADNLVLNVPRRHTQQAKRQLTRLMRGQRWEVKDDPDTDHKVCGWTWHGLADPAGLFGWRSSRRMRKAARGKIPRWERAEAAARLSGDGPTATRYKHRVQGTRVYLAGPARGNPRAPAYASSKV